MNYYSEEQVEEMIRVAAESGLERKRPTEQIIVEDVFAEFSPDFEPSDLSDLKVEVDGGVQEPCEWVNIDLELMEMSIPGPGKKPELWTSDEHSICILTKDGLPLVGSKSKNHE